MSNTTINFECEQYKNAPESLRNRYEIYVKCAGDLGWIVKSFIDWVNS